MKKKNEILWSLKLANCRNNQSFSGYTENKLHELKTKKIKSSNTSNTIKEIHKKHLLPRVQWVLNDNVFWKVGGNAADRSGVTNRLSRYIYLYINLNFFFQMNVLFIHVRVCQPCLYQTCRDGAETDPAIRKREFQTMKISISKLSAILNLSFVKKPKTFKIF